MVSFKPDAVVVWYAAASDTQSFERSFIMIVRIPLAAALVGASLLAAAPLAALAQNSIVGQTASAATFLNGGIGSDAAAAMRRIAHEYPLRMTFSERKDGEFVADVPVVITDTHGKPVFELHNAGPLLYVMLPKGTYKVNARFKGQAESQRVTLDGKNGRDLYFHWTGKPTA